MPTFSSKVGGSIYVDDRRNLLQEIRVSSQPKPFETLKKREKMITDEGAYKNALFYLWKADRMLKGPLTLRHL